MKGSDRQQTWQPYEGRIEGKAEWTSLRRPAGGHTRRNPGLEISISLPQTSQPERTRPHPSKTLRRKTKKQQDRQPTRTDEVSSHSTYTPAGQRESPAADVGSAAGKDTRQAHPAGSDR